jgi:ABC-type glycerol-3-phosphate transport system substrate-binding protein
MYVNTENYGGTVNNVITKLSEISKSETGLADNIAINKDYEQLYKGMFSGDNLYTDKYVIEDAINSFTTGQLTYYFSTTNDHDYIQQKMPGIYSVVYVDNGKATIQYTDCYSINNNLSKEQKKAAIVFYRYMLSAKGQNMVYIDNGVDGVPLNKTTYKDYIVINGELGKILNVIVDFNQK